MNAIHRIAVCCLVLVATVGAARAETARADLEARGLRPLNDGELRDFLTGNTLYHVNRANNVRVPLLYLADGSRYVRIRGQVLKTSWRIERNMVCEESVVLKREVCRSLYRVDGGGAVCDEGADTCAYGLDWAPGNPERLGP